MTERPPFDPTRLSLLPSPRYEDDDVIKRRGKETVLVVDDDATVRMMIKRSLVRADFQVLEAGDGEVALQLLDTKEVDLVLLDVRMPGIDGIELCTEIRRRWDSLRLPVIFITGLSDREARVWCKAVGGDEFLTKPMDETELLIRVENLLRLHRYHQRIVDHNEYLEDMIHQRTEVIRVALHEVERREANLQSVLEETIGRLAAALEHRQVGFVHQVDRIGHYAGMLASKAGLTAAQVEEIRVATGLHDAGMVAVPREIVLKPGPLDEEERFTVCRHADLGRWILGSSDATLLQTAATIAWTHHERFDGSGYPRGLVGEEIPMVGRIAAVADVFDALTTKRPWREAMSVDEAVKTMQSELGSALDPELLGHFLDSLDEVVGIMQRFADRSVD